MRALAEHARAASRLLATAPTALKDRALVAAARALRKGAKDILKANARSATTAPIFPQPIRPRFLANSSTPMKRFFSHLPA